MQKNKETIELINQSLEKVVTNITLPIAIRLVMTILKRMYPDRDFDWLYELILFKTNPSLSFQSSDVNYVFFSITDDESDIKVEMQLNFLSIFGTSSPLPYHYNEAVLEDSYNDKVLLDFLDMYNHRLKKLIYPIWRKQRYYIQYENDLKDSFSGYILSILGLHDEAYMKETSLDLHKLLPFAGVLSMKQKSTETLLSILKHYFSHKYIRIEEGIISKSTLPKDQYVMLGDDNCSLGVDMSIGEFTLTRNLKFRIHFDKISWEELQNFSKNGIKRKQLRVLLNYIQTDPLDYDFTVTINKDKIKPCIMGKDNEVYLGVNGWIGNVDEDKTIVI
jgi:type VI secretion system protein ImpH